jgi:high affinity sulfate transporter 1
MNQSEAGLPARGRGLEKWVPGIRSARTYQRGWLRRDLVAAIVLSALLVPQGMAYAELAGLPAITGLYTTVVCLVAYAAFGPSPYLVLGPDSSLGPIIAAVILPLAAGSMERAVGLAGALALLVGAIAIGAGLARLGFVSDLLSQPVRLGYMAGLAVVIVVGQLPQLFGFEIDGGNVLVVIHEFVTNLDQTNLYALGVGLLALGIIVGLKRSRPALPGILIGVVIAIVLSVLLDLASRGVDVVGVLPQGFPVPSLPAVELSDLPLLVGGAIGITLVAVGDTVSVSAGFASKRGTELDTDQEIVAIGAANVAAGFFQGFPVSTSSSRTAVADQAGAKTQLTGLAAAGLVLAMLLFAPGTVQWLPMSVLSAVIIVAGATLLDRIGIRRLWHVRRSEFAVAAICFLGVTLVGVLEGIVIAVVVAVFQIFIRAWQPYSAILGKPKDVPGYHDVTRYPHAAQVPGLVVLRWDAPLFFANSIIFRDRVRKLALVADPAPRWILIAAEPITDIDTTAADMLVKLDEELNADGIHLVFAELKDPVRDKIERYSLYDTIDPNHFYPTIKSAIKAFRAESSGEPISAGQAGDPGVGTGHYPSLEPDSKNEEQW